MFERVSTLHCIEC